MTRVPGWCVSIVSVWIALMAAGEAAAQEPAKLKAAFEEYCQAPDKSAWFCGPRAATLSASHKYDVVRGHCQKHASAPACEPLKLAAPLALEFDAKRRAWDVKRPDMFKGMKRRLEFDPVTTLPIAYLKRGDVMSIDVVANPLVYLANRGEAKEENIAEVKALEQLLALAGGLAAGLVKDLGADWFRANEVARARFHERFERGEFALTSRDPVLTDEELFKADVVTIDKWTASAKLTFSGLDARLLQMKTVRADLQRLAQHLEIAPATFDLARLDPALEDPKEWADEFAAVDEAVKALPSLAACPAVFDAASALLAVNTADAVAVHAAALRFEQLLRPPSASPCAALAYPDRLSASLTAVRDAAAAAARAPEDTTLQATLRDAHASARERHMTHAIALARRVQSFVDLVGKVKEALTKEEEIRKAALVLRGASERVKDAGTEPGEGTTVKLHARIYLPDEEYDTAWTKVRTNPVQMAVNSPYADAVPVEKKEIATSYRVMRAGTENLSFGVGMLFTDAVSVTYAAVDPNPAQNTTTTVTTVTGGSGQPTTTTTVQSPEAKIIAEKDLEPRQGSYGLFVNYRSWGSTKVGVGGQFGVAMSLDKPGAMYGLAINASPYVTVGVGMGSFRVKTLDPMQTIGEGGSTVYSDADIRTRTFWDETYYFSLSVNVNELPLFK